MERNVGCRCVMKAQPFDPFPCSRFGLSSQKCRDEGKKGFWKQIKLEVESAFCMQTNSRTHVIHGTMSGFWSFLALSVLKHKHVTSKWKMKRSNKLSKLIAFPCYYIDCVSFVYCVLPGFSGMTHICIFPTSRPPKRQSVIWHFLS